MVLAKLETFLSIVNAIQKFSEMFPAADDKIIVLASSVALF